jgi:FKBP-type peptidyl-prolyl cis-trans isomerase FkpA
MGAPFFIDLLKMVKNCSIPNKRLFLCIMLKNKILLVAVAFAGIISSCSKDTPYDKSAQFKIDSALIEKYIANNGIKDVKKEKGVFYKIVNQGTGTDQIDLTDTLALFYDGRVLGAVKAFDSVATVTPRSFVLKDVILGWQIGVPLIKNGGRIRLIIPSTLAYIDRPIGPIPANSILDFNININQVTKKKKTITP